LPFWYLAGKYSNDWRLQGLRVLSYARKKELLDIYTYCDNTSVYRKWL